MSKRFIGTLDVNKLAQAIKANHSSLFTTEKGFRGANIVIWENDTPDQFGNTHSVQLNSKQGVTEDKCYFINAKPPQERAAPVTVVTAQDITNDLPF